MAGEYETHRRDGELQKEIIGRLAVLGDRAIRPVAVKPTLDSTVGMLRDKLRMENPREFEIIATALRRCGIELPHKVPIYAAIVGLLTSGNAMFARPLAHRVTDAVVKTFHASLRDGKSALARRSLRYLGCLCAARVITTASLADYLCTLLKAALSAMTANDAASGERRVHARGQFFADIALSVFPWIGTMFKKSDPEQLGNLVALATQVFDAWKPNDWRALANASSSISEEMFIGLMNAIRALQKLDWEVTDDLIPDFNSEYLDEFMDGQQLELPALVVPSHSKRSKYAPPRHRLRLINQAVKAKESAEMSIEAAVKEEDKAVNGKQDGNGIAENGETNGGDTGENLDRPDMKEAAKEVEIFVKLSYVSDILDNFSTNHKMAAERMLTMPMLSESNDVVVEGLFSEMCTLPLPPFTCVYYGILFVDLCKVKDSRLPVKLLSAVETMFQQSDELDPETFDRLTTWFAFHLSNFGYRWNWSDWGVYADADMEKEFPYRALFCRDVLKRCIYLSYYDQISDIIPEEMKYFLPIKPTDGNTSRFVEDINAQLLSIVTGSGKQPPAVVKEKLAELFPDRSDNMDDEAKLEGRHQVTLKRLTALLRAILQAGFKTLSHFDTVAIRYIEILHELTAAGGKDARQAIAEEVSVFWDSSHLRRLYVLDKLSMNGVIDGAAILDCVLSLKSIQDAGEKTVLELQQELGNSDTWNIVRLVLERATAREEGARLELTTASQVAAKATEGDAQAMEARLERAKSGTVKSVQVIKDCLSLVLSRLFAMSDKLLTADPIMDNGNDDDNEYHNSLPGLNGAPLWLWRCMGMVRECGRKHPKYVGQLLDELRKSTQEGCARHRQLAKTMRVLEELAASDILAQAH